MIRSNDWDIEVAISNTQSVMFTSELDPEMACQLTEVSKESIKSLLRL